MAQFKKKNTYKFWHSPLALLALFCIFVAFAYNMLGLIKKQRDTGRNKASELNRIEELRKREALLSADIEKLNTEEGIEASVRDKFQVVKPGEKEVLIIDEQTKKSEVETPTDHSFWGFIKRMFSK